MICEQSEGKALDCVICLGKLPANGDIAHPEKCNHQFCYTCIQEWMKRRSECPLCKQPASALIVTNKDGKVTKIAVKKRTEAQFEREIARAENYEEHVEMDISVMYATCQVCHRSDNEHLLMLCDGIVGQNVDGSPIYCNAGCHCYCLPEKLTAVPDGDWYCSFCSDFRATQQSVYNSRYATRDRRSQHLESYRTPLEIDSSDEPGTSGVGRVEWDDESDSSDDDSIDNNTEVLSEADCDDAQLLDERAFWSEQDDEVLAENFDETRSDRGLIEVSWRRRSVRKRKTKRSKKVKAEGRKKVIGKKKSKSRRRRKRRIARREKEITPAQWRLAEAIGFDPITGKTRQRGRRRRKGLSDGNYRNLCGASSLLIDRLDELSVPYDEPEQDPPKVENKPEAKNAGDIMDVIMCEQEKTFAPSKYQRIQRNGTIENTEEMAEFRKNMKKMENVKKSASSSVLHDSIKLMQRLDTSETESKEKRKKRMTRWGSPTTSEQVGNAASIPLPSGPPIAQTTVPLENIPVPMPVNQHSFTQMTLPQKPSALNTTPSTSFAMNAATVSLPSFAVGGAPIGGQTHLNLSAFAAGSGLNQQIGIGLNQQPLAGLGQPPQLTSLGQNSLVQMQPTPIIPNLFLPPLNISTMNNLLTAGFLASNNAMGPPAMTQSLTQPITQSSTVPAGPFILNPVQFATSNQNLSQHIANFTTYPRNAYPLSVAPQHASRPLEGVPPPPPVAKISHAESESNISACEPLAEKIRKLVEACNVRPLCGSSTEENAADAPSSHETQNDEKPMVKGNVESGRKSASADDEETGEMNLKLTRQHKNGGMFEEARAMLSTALKKAYRQKQITKDEYKKIMKKGVTALSQRTKLDQRKVDEYAAKYVECVAHRRKKRH